MSGGNEGRRTQVAQVFISYAREDRERAGSLAAILEHAGWSVWWDSDIRLGSPFGEVIEEMLDGAACVVVLWSSFAIKSTWVKAEAQVGLDRKILVPIQLEHVRVPLPFGQIQSAELWNWQGASDHPEVAKIVQHIRGLVGESHDSDRALGVDRARTLVEGIVQPHADLAGRALVSRSAAWRRRARPMAAVLVGLLGVGTAIATRWRHQPSTDLPSPGSTSHAQSTPGVMPEQRQLPPMDAARADRILGSLPKERLAKLRELMFIADLQDAPGNERSAGGFISRLERRMKSSVVLSPTEVTEMIRDAREALASYPPRKKNEEPEAYDYDRASDVASAAIAHLPSRDECFDRIREEDPEVAAAFFTKEYFSTDHYHDYNMKERLFQVLVDGNFGRAPLGVVESLLAVYGPGQPPNSYMALYHQKAVTAARKILGDEFPAWYEKVRGISYEEELRRSHRPDGSAR